MILIFNKKIFILFIFLLIPTFIYATDYRLKNLYDVRIQSGQSGGSSCDWNTNATIYNNYDPVTTLMVIGRESGGSCLRAGYIWDFSSVTGTVTNCTLEIHYTNAYTTGYKTFNIMDNNYGKWYNSSGGKYTTTGSYGNLSVYAFNNTLGYNTLVKYNTTITASTSGRFNLSINLSTCQRWIDTPNLNGGLGIWNEHDESNPVTDRAYVLNTTHTGGNLYIYVTTGASSATYTAGYGSNSISNNSRINTYSPAADRLINVTCTPSSNISIYFNTTSKPTDRVAYSINASSLLWSINLTYPDGEYFYYGYCGEMSNTTVNKVTIDNTAPRIYIQSDDVPNINGSASLARNFVTNGNYSLIDQFRTPNGSINAVFLSNDTGLNFTDVYAIEINATNETGYTVFFYNITLSPLYSVYQLLVNMSFPNLANRSLLYIKYSVADAHTKINKSADFKPITKNKEINFNFKNKKSAITSEDNSIVTVKEYLDKYSFSFNFTDGKKKTRKFYITSDVAINYLDYYTYKTPYKGHFILSDRPALGGQWIDHAGLQYWPDVKKLTDYSYELVTNDEIDFITFNSTGTLNTNSRTLEFYKGGFSEIKPTLTSGNPISISLNVSNHIRFSLINATVRFNNTDITNYTVVTTADSYLFTAHIDPITVLTDKNITYNWTVRVYQSDYIHNYTFYVSGLDSITSYSVDNCTLSSFKTLTFTSYDELNVNQKLDATWEVYGSYWIDPVAKSPIYFHNNFNINDTISLCIYPQGITLYSDIYIKYTTPLGFTHRYYLINETLTNNTNTYNLYNFNTTTGISDLKITVKRAEDYQNWPNIIAKLQKNYIGEGVWRTVQMDETGEFSELFFNIIEQTADYRLIYFDRWTNRILKTTSSSKFLCSSGLCDVTQLLSNTSTSTSTTLPNVEINYNNNTHILTLNFNVLDGENINFYYKAYRDTITGDLVLCQNSSLSASSGNLYCNLTGQTGTIRIDAYSSDYWLKTQYIQLPENQLKNFISIAESSIYTFIIMLVVVMVGVVLGNLAAIITTILGLFLISFLGLFNPFTAMFIGVALIMALYISWRMGSNG